MKKLALSLLLLIPLFAWSQTNLNGHRYKYRIEAPIGFYEKAPVGVHVDLSLTDRQGNSMNVVVTKLPPAAIGKSVVMMKDLTEDFLVENLEQTMDNVKLIKRGVTQIGTRDYYFFRYLNSSATSPTTFYTESYVTWYGNNQYTVTAMCPQEKRDGLAATFYRAIHSFRL